MEAIRVLHKERFQHFLNGEVAEEHRMQAIPGVEEMSGDTDIVLCDSCPVPDFLFAFHSPHLNKKESSFQRFVVILSRQHAQAGKRPRGQGAFMPGRLGGVTQSGE
ncbi:MAG: hypothetical protein M1550_00795 [Deltaproteobacteria bacterium]|nr:hypothetical protein [Deltaproteobacteria bacterium]